MSTEYDAITAFHYASYRPRLHYSILQSSLGNTSIFSGLDIGCGTGQSSIALSNFCRRVVSIDPSSDMISKGKSHTKVRYSIFDKTSIDFETDTFDIITLAGSLWYAKSQELLNEIIRVGTKNSLVLVYDFEILLENILLNLGFESQADPSGSYNHEEDFSGLDAHAITLVNKEIDKFQVQITVNDLAHLVLSVKEQYTCFGNLYGFHFLYDTIVEKLNSINETGFFDIQANTFSTLYRLI